MGGGGGGGWAERGCLNVECQSGLAALPMGGGGGGRGRNISQGGDTTPASTLVYTTFRIYFPSVLSPV